MPVRPDPVWIESAKQSSYHKEINDARKVHLKGLTRKTDPVQKQQQVRQFASAVQTAVSNRDGK